MLDTNAYEWRDITGDPESPYRIHHEMCVLGTTAMPERSTCSFASMPRVDTVRPTGT